MGKIEKGLGSGRESFGTAAGKSAPSNADTQAISQVPETPVADPPRWRILYKEAMLEMDTQRVKGRVADALVELLRRRSELERHPTDHVEEWQQVADAIASLLYWDALADARKQANPTSTTIH